MALTKIARPSSIDTTVADCVTELMNAAVSFHKFHLKVTGVGSDAAHRALKEMYEALPGHADALAENYQGATEKLLSCSDKAHKMLSSVEEALGYLRELTQMINGLQGTLPYSEIVNDLDNVKSTINGVKYKLLFLK